MRDRNAEKMIERVEKDEFFMQAMSGEKQVIMTGELFGARWKIKMDSYLPGQAIVDLKTVRGGFFIPRTAGHIARQSRWPYGIQNSWS